MDPVSAIGVAAAVAQFMSLGLAVAQRLAEYTNTSPTEVPRALQNINVQLPLLLNSLSRVKTEETVSQYDTDTRCMLRGVVSGCLKLVQEIEIIAVKLTPEPGEHFRSKLKKVLSSLNSDEKIADIDRGLQTYIQVLILHHVVDRHEAEHTPLDEQGYFEVKEKLALEYVRRDALIEKLDKAFHATIRRQKDRPQYILLPGIGGAGKTQLALGYCREAYDIHQFRTVFWLDGSSPEALEVGLEGAAAAVRRKKDGTRREKIEFMIHFLERRWEPWLLVVDDYNPKAFEADDISAWLPRTGYGGILLVTNSESTPQAPAVHVTPFLDPVREKHVRDVATGAVERSDFRKMEIAIADGLDINQKDSNGWYFLARATIHGSEPIVRLLLQAGADPNIDSTKISSVVWAASHGDASILALLLDHEDEAGSRASDEQYLDALSRAIGGGHVDVVKLLLQRRLHTVNMDNEEMSAGFAKCAREGKLDLLEFLCSKNWIPSSDKLKANALVNAINEGHLEVVKYLISKASFPANTCNEYDMPVLVTAAAIQDRLNPNRDAMISFLLSAGADPNVKAGDGETALQAAALREFTSTMQLLLDAGADPTIADNLGFKPLTSASKYKSPGSYPILADVKITDDERRKEYFASALHYAARTGDRELLVAIIDKIEIDAVQEFSGCTALLLAIRGSHLQAARYLVRKGASQSIKNRDGALPLLLAAEAGMDLLVRDLVKAKDSLGVDVADEKGNTALILAAGKGHEKVVTELLNLHADREKENKVGDRAIDVAEEKRLEKVIKLLEDL